MTRTVRTVLGFAIGLLGAAFGCSASSGTAPSSGPAGASTGANTSQGGTQGSGGSATATGGGSHAGTSSGGASSGGASTSGGASPSGGSNGVAGAGGALSTASVGAAVFAAGDLDPPTDGGTITMQTIGALGSYPSVRDPASGMCDAYNAKGCCMATHQLTDDKLTPWNEELILTLRGPLLMKQFVVYQPPAAGADHWSAVSVWDDRNKATATGVVFDGNATKATGTFSGTVGSECLINAETDKAFPCGSMSSPYCTPPGAGQHKNYGWTGSKLIVLLANMPNAGSAQYPANTHCDTGTTGGWYDAPWLGLSVGELIRSGAFSFCQCYAKSPDNNGPADGCGQFNVFEVVNDNNTYKNLSVFSTDAVDYQKYVGEGPCGTACNAAKFPATADLIDKATSGEAAQGAITTPDKGPGAAFRRPANGYRYFIMLLDVDQRVIQLAIVHPMKIPAALSGILPNFPLDIPQSAIDSALAMRLPK